VLEAEWVTEMRIRWAARRAQAEGGSGGDGAAWLDGDAARALSCDALITPHVTCDIDPSALDDLVRLCLQLAGHGAHCARPRTRLTANPTNPADPASPAARAAAVPAVADVPLAGLAQLTAPSREAIQQAIIGKTIDFPLHL
jgi:hypothetical protein